MVICPQSPTVTVAASPAAPPTASASVTVKTTGASFVPPATASAPWTATAECVREAAMPNVSPCATVNGSATSARTAQAAARAAISNDMFFMGLPPRF